MNRGTEPARTLLLVFVSAVLFRIALYWCGLVQVVYETSDSPEYRNLAWSLVQHGVFGLDGVPKMNRTPGYPAFLASVFSLLGTSRLAVTSAQVVLDSLTCVMVVHAAMALRANRAAVLIVAVMAVTCVYTSMYSLMMMTEVLYTFLIAAAVWVLVTSPKPGGEALFEATLPRVVISAAALGCGVLVRPALAPPAALFGALIVGAGLLRARRTGFSARTLLQPVAFALAMALVVGPWMLRNYIVFHFEYVKPDNDQVTLLGYKSDMAGYRHWYTPQVLAYLYSNEEPFVMTQTNRPPVTVRYVYPGELKDVEQAFSVLEQEMSLGPQPIQQSTLDEFQRIADARYRAAPRLYVTGPVSRALKLWVAPRISVFWLDTSGHNSSLALIAGFTGYNLLYVVPGFIGLLWGLRQLHRTGFLYVLAMIAGHTWMYAVWLPWPQSRYAIPIFPLLSLTAGLAVHALSAGWLPGLRRDGAACGGWLAREPAALPGGETLPPPSGRQFSIRPHPAAP